MVNLMEHDVEGSQAHVYGGWPEAGVQDEDKKRLAEQVSAKIGVSFVRTLDVKLTLLLSLLFY